MWPLYLAILTTLTYITYHRLLHPLAHVPGPFLASITPLWLVWQCMHTRRPRLDLELHKKYGSVVRIAPDQVIFSNPAYFKTVYGAGTKFRKSKYYAAPAVPQAESWESLDMLVETNVEKLRVQKRLAGPIYSVANAKKHERLIDNNLARWLKRLETVAGKPLNFYHEVELLIVDIVCEITFSEPYGAVEAGSDGGHMETMWQFWEHISWLGNLPWLNAFEKKVMPWMTPLLPKPDLPVFPYCDGRIAAYQHAQDTGRTFPPCIHDDFVKLSRQKPEFRPNWGLRLSKTNIGAGVDTMSQTIAAAINGLCHNPGVHARLKAELDAAAAAVQQPNPIRKTDADPIVPYDSAAQCSYLQASLHEAMRVWPNIAIALPRSVPSGGIALDGHYIPEGYTVGMNPRQLGLSEEVFGPDTHIFHPERWLQASREARNDMESRNLAFGGPSRKCPGMHLAWLICSKTLATLFLNFEPKVLNTLDGPPGPGGGKWVEQGTFPTR